MSYANVKFNEECKSLLIEGVNLITDAVTQTFGPNAANVAIKTGDTVRVTKDGATVCQAVSDPNEYIQMGINLIRDISVKTAKDVGDGSSSVAILARAIVNKFKDEKDPVSLSRRLQYECRETIKYLSENKKLISSKEDLAKVATLSANNDSIIGNIIAEAFYKVGKNGIVQFERSEDVSDRVEYTDGFRIDNGYASTYFINTVNGTCELENVYVYISDTKISEVKDVVEIANKAMKDSKSLLLIAPSFDSEITIFLQTNLNLLKSCTVISPGHRHYRDILIDDIKDLLGKSSTCKKVIITKDNTTFSGYESDKDKINAKVKKIKRILKAKKMCEFDLDFHKKRLANFTSGIATIYVGGYSKAEVSERYDRFEDAIRATDASMQEGILPGGGFALLQAAKALNDNKISCENTSELGSVITTPIELLSDSDMGIPVCYDFWEGANWKNCKIGNLYELGVIEPFLVTKTVLENAVSTACMILTCNCCILNNVNDF